MTEVADTSLQAFKQKIEDGSRLTDKQRCFKIIDEYGPITSSEMERHMGKNKYSFSGRINELKNDNLVEVTGTRDGHQVLEISDNRSKRDSRSFVTVEECGSVDTESVDGLFVEKDEEDEKNDKQDDGLEAGDLIWG